MFRWQTGADIAAGHGEGFFEANGQALLPAAGDERGASGGADAGVGVGLGEPDALGGEAIDVRGGVVAAAVAGEVGVAEVVGHDEQEVGAGVWRGAGAEGGGEKLAARQLGIHLKRLAHVHSWDAVCCFKESGLWQLRIVPRPFRGSNG